MIGNVLVEKLLISSNDVFIINRGIHKVNYPIKANYIQGDRNQTSTFRTIKNVEFDVCIDTCCYFSEQVDFVKSHVNTDLYVLISTINVLERDLENNDFYRIKDPIFCSSCLINPSIYPQLKSGCEEVTKKIWENYLIIRPAILLGLNDHTKRIFFWNELQDKTNSLIQFNGYDPSIQIITAEYLVNQMLELCESKSHGEKNFYSAPISFNQFLRCIRKVNYSNIENSVKYLDYEKVKSLENIPYISDAIEPLLCEAISLDKIINVSLQDYIFKIISRTINSSEQSNRREFIDILKLISNIN